MRLFLGIYDRPGGTLLLDASYKARNAEYSKDRHGPKALRFDIDLPFYEALRLYEQVKTPHVLLSHGLTPIWTGRLEDPELSLGESASGLSIQALGYWRAFSDLPYTAPWSTTNLNDWKPVDFTQQANRKKDMYTMDTNNRVFTGLNKNATYGVTADVGEQYFDLPSGSSRTIQQVTFTYSYDLPAGWTAAMNYYTSANFGGAATSSHSLTSAGAVLSGSATVNVPSGSTIGFLIYNNSGAPVTYTGENGAKYARWSDVRVKTTTSSTVTASAIAQDLLQAVRAVNNTQLDSSTQLIQNPGLDLRDEWTQYLDANMGQILDRLAALGDTQTPPRIWEAGIDLAQRLYFRPRGSAGRAWLSDVTDLRVVRPTDATYNSAYGVYQDANNETVRTAIATDAASVARWGLTRRAAVEARTTSATQAATHRDTFLEDRADPVPQAELPIAEVYDSRGTRWPLWMVEPGATITARNLARTLGSTIDRIRTFLVDEVTYNLDDDTLGVVPESRRDSLDTVFLRREAGVQ